MTAKKLSGIQYLRAIAAVAVVFDHTVGMATFEKYMNIRAPYYDFWVTGLLEVNLFFVYCYLFNRRRHIGRRVFLDFIIARAIVILPMMWLAISSYYLLRALGRGYPGKISPYINSLLLRPLDNYEPKNI